MTRTEFKKIEGYPNYRINKVGEVYHGDQKVEPFIHNSRNKYYIGLLNDKRVGCSHDLARTVYETFLKKIPDTYRLVYKDGNILNYRLDNLDIKYRFKKAAPKKPLKLDPKKKWKDIIGYEGLYKISDHGDVYSVTSCVIIKPHLRGKGYYCVTLTKNKKKKTQHVHLLVFKTFVKKKLDGDNVVDHIDRNKTNNCVGNLREATRSLNAKNIDKRPKYNLDPVIQYTTEMEFVQEWESADAVVEAHPEYRKDSISHCCVKRKKTAYGFIWRYRDYAYDQSDYHPINTYDGKTYSNYKINKDGKVINIYNGRPMKLKLNEYYHTHIISDCGKRRSLTIHRLVAMTFIPNPDKHPVVNHIDEDKFNNNVDNLEWCDHSHNTKHTLGKMVQQIDPKTGEVINTFKSTTCAYESLNRTGGYPWGIGRVCNRKQETAYGYKWRFVND